MSNDVDRAETHSFPTIQKWMELKQLTAYLKKKKKKEEREKERQKEKKVLEDC